MPTKSKPDFRINYIEEYLSGLMQTTLIQKKVPTLKTQKILLSKIVTL